MYRASLQTRHFSFEAYGDTYRDAVETLLAGWRTHRVQTAATMTEQEVLDGMETHQIGLGVCYRDGEPLKSH